MNYNISYFIKGIRKPRPSIFLLCIVFVLIHMWFVYFTLNFIDKVSTFFLISSAEQEYPVNHTKYILVWNHENLINNNVLSKNCSSNKCIFVKNNLLIKDHERFDAILFKDRIQSSTEQRNTPNTRLLSQIYIFSSVESPHYVPACELYNDGFFNWTFTYRLDSDVVWSFFLIRNLSGALVAPGKSVQWQRSSAPISTKIKSKLSNKTKAAAWLVSHCKTDSLRDEYLTQLQEHLFHFALKIDVYGKCSGHKCPENNCNSMISRNYYFYMAFENSFSEDYVTEKVLHGYKNNAVPIVFGGANYSRFLPPGSYINAREMHPYNLAYAMHKAIKDPNLYESYFKWTNLYSVEVHNSEQALCRLCEALHSDRAAETPAKQNFRFWWNGLSGMKWCLSKEYWNEMSLMNVEWNHMFRQK